tara:strand:+ start:3704 stop:4042 length:339 start_codon:yes stop_codon:yes gene_type:complete
MFSQAHHHCQGVDGANGIDTSVFVRTVAHRGSGFDAELFKRIQHSYDAGRRMGLLAVATSRMREHVVVVRHHSARGVYVAGGSNGTVQETPTREYRVDSRRMLDLYDDYICV